MYNIHSCTLLSHGCFALKAFDNLELTLEFFSFVFILAYASTVSIFKASYRVHVLRGTPRNSSNIIFADSAFFRMAEAGESADGASSQIGGITLTNDIIFGQSKSGSSNFVQFKDLEDVGSEKNKLYLVCLHCNCKIMAPGYATLVAKEVLLCSNKDLIQSTFP